MVQIHSGAPINIMIKIVFLLCIVLVVIIIFKKMINPLLPKIFCNFGFHLSPTHTQTCDCCITGYCPRCNKQMIRDNQGNWY